MRYTIGASSTTTATVKATDYTPKSVAIEDIKRLVSDVTGIPLEDIMSKKRFRRLKQARWLIWEVMYSLGYSCLDCARTTSHNHATVLNGLAKIAYDAQNDRLLAEWRNLLSSARAGKI